MMNNQPKFKIGDKVNLKAKHQIIDNCVIREVYFDDKGNYRYSVTIDLLDEMELNFLNMLESHLVKSDNISGGFKIKENIDAHNAEINVKKEVEKLNKLFYNDNGGK